MSKIQIICTKPGMRRNGVEHPATATYEHGYWTSTQINAFKDDKSFVVQEIDDGAVVVRGPEFDQAVSAEVAKQMSDKGFDLQLKFNSAVEDAVAEKTIDLQKLLDAANAEIAATPDKVEAAVEFAMRDLDKALLDKVKALGEENAALSEKLLTKQNEVVELKVASAKTTIKK